MLDWTLYFPYWTLGQELIQTPHKLPDVEEPVDVVGLKRLGYYNLGLFRGWLENIFDFDAF